MLKVAIIGASGYTGAELVRILVNHPEVELAYLSSEKYQGQKFSHLYPNLLGFCDLEFSSLNLEQVKERAELIFTALPHGSAMKYVPKLLGGKRKVIDLSGDFRLKEASIYEAWYKMPHLAPDLLPKAVYGLPEVNRADIKETDFVSNPGCYPTSAILGMAPLLDKGLVEEGSIIVDAKSGVSGAGRTPTEEVHFARCGESIKAYGIASHKHTPEMEQEMSKIARTLVKISFTAHLVPMSRGILSTIYGALKEDLETGDLIKIYQEFYQDEPFIKVLPEGVYPETKYLTGSNYCQIGLKIDSRTKRAVVVSAIDNLVKGAAGQAIQNMNLMAGFEETAGLMGPGMFP